MSALSDTSMDRLSRSIIIIIIISSSSSSRSSSSSSSLSIVLDPSLPDGPDHAEEGAQDVVDPGNLGRLGFRV